MRKVYLLAVTGLVVALVAGRSLFFPDSGEDDREGVVRIAAPAAPPATPVFAVPSKAAASAPQPAPTSEPGNDPPPPPQEPNSPDFAKLGVQPAI